jgi:FixJ family two-component response regulator
MRDAALISIVDDDESIREATKGLVRSLGYRAAAFASAEEFLQSGKLDETACLITDVEMPGVSGIELQRRLIAQGNFVPTIFITAFPEAAGRQTAFAAGVVGFLDKPFSEQSLVHCLETALRSSNDKIPQP